MEMEIGRDMIWLGQSGFHIRAGGKHIFIDPFRIREQKERADLLLITHAHHDHYDPESMRKVLKPGTVIIASGLCKGIESFGKVTIAKPGFSKEVLGFGIEAIPAYNIMESRLGFHPRRNDWLGYVLDIGGERIYHAGDTDFTPEMRDLKDLDIALIPIGGTYTMDVEEGIAAANEIDAKRVAPIHYRMLLGEGASDAEKRFKDRVGNSLILTEGE